MIARVGRGEEGRTGNDGRIGGCICDKRYNDAYVLELQSAVFLKGGAGYIPGLGGGSPSLPTGHFLHTLAFRPARAPLLVPSTVPPLDSPTEPPRDVEEEEEEPPLTLAAFPLAAKID